MPTERPLAAADFAVRSRRVIRLGLGTAVAMAVSQAGGWTLSFLVPILTMTLLALPLSRPPPKLFVAVIIALIVSVYGGFLFLPMLLNQTLAGVLLLSLVLFHSFYHTARGGPAVVGTLVTIGLALVVAVGSVSVDALQAAAEGVAIGAFVGVAIAALCHALLPDPSSPPPTPARPAPAGKLSLTEARRRAMRSMSMVFPVIIWFLLSSASASNVAVMIKVASMGQEAAEGAAGNAARSLLKSTLIGGIAAVLAWELLTIWPSLIFYSLLIALAGLVFGMRIFCGRGLCADGATWSYALLTLIVVLAPAALDSQFGSAADARFYDRLIMFAGASLYGVGAAYVFDAFFPARNRSEARSAAVAALR